MRFRAARRWGAPVRVRGFQEGVEVTKAGENFMLDNSLFRGTGAVYRNLSVPILYEHAIRRGEGEVGAGGSFVARTGIHTGRSPKDKYFVEEPTSKNDI